MPARAPVLLRHSNPQHPTAQPLAKVIPSECSAGLFEAARQIAAKRCQLISQLRTALRAGRDDEALQLARELCGVSCEITQRKTGPRDARNVLQKAPGNGQRRTKDGGAGEKRSKE